MKKFNLITILMATIAIIFFITSAAFGTDALKIDASGNVGIGVEPSSSYKLYVYGPSGSYPARVGSPDGYLCFGPGNTNWSHFTTDRPRFYFNTGVTVNSGLIGSYDEDLSLQTSGTTRMTISNTTGNVGIGTTPQNAKLHIYQSDTTSGAMVLFENTDGKGEIHTQFNNLYFDAADNGQDMMIRGADGNVGMGTGYSGSADWTLAVYDSSETGGIFGMGGTYGVYGGYGSTYGVYGYGSSYDFYAAGPGTNYGYASSIRLKKNITQIDNALDKVMKLKGVYFDWNINSSSLKSPEGTEISEEMLKEWEGLHDMGFIAEDVGVIVPEVVQFEDSTDPSNWYTDGETGESKLYATGMDYGALTPLLAEAIKELKKENDSLYEIIEELEDRIAKLETIK